MKRGKSGEREGKVHYLPGLGADQGMAEIKSGARDGARDRFAETQCDQRSPGIFHLDDGRRQAGRGLIRERRHEAAIDHQRRWRHGDISFSALAQGKPHYIIITTCIQFSYGQRG